MIDAQKEKKSNSELWLFVNKTVESHHLSRSVQREKFLIHSHVQGRWRRQQAEEDDGDGEAAEKDAFPPFDFGKDTAGRHQGAHHPHRIHTREHERDLGLLDKSTTIEKDIKDTVRSRQQVERKRPTGPVRITLPRPCLDTIDPFGAFPIHLNAKVYRLLGYYRLVFHNVVSSPSLRKTVPFLQHLLILFYQ